MSKYSVIVSYMDGTHEIESDDINDCIQFLNNDIKPNRKFEHIYFSYALDMNSNEESVKLIDRKTKDVIDIIPRHVGVGMLFSLQGILVRNNQL